MICVQRTTIFQKRSDLKRQMKLRIRGILSPAGASFLLDADLKKPEKWYCAVVFSRDVVGQLLHWSSVEILWS